MSYTKYEEREVLDQYFSTWSCMTICSFPGYFSGDIGKTCINGGSDISLGVQLVGQGGHEGKKAMFRKRLRNTVLDHKERLV